MAEYKRKNVKKLKNVKPKKSAVADSYKISSFAEKGFIDEIDVKSAEEARAQRKTEKKKEKYLSRKQPEKRVVYSGKTAEELNSTANNIRVVRGTGNIKKIKRICAAACGLLIIAAIVVIQLVTPTGIIDGIRTSFATGGSGNGYPLSVNGNNCYSIKKVGNCYAVLTDTYIEMYNAASKQLVAEQHGFAEPKITVSESRALLYDQGSNGISVYDASGKLFDKTAKDEIITASVSRNGSFAVVTDGDNSAAKMTFYNKEGSKISSYTSSADLINAAAVSNNGKSAAALTVNAEDGKYSCSLLVFDGDDFKTVTEHKLDSLALSLDPIGGNSYAVASATGSFIFNQDAKEKIAVTDTAVQYKTLNSTGGYCNVLGVNGTGEQSKLILVNNKGEKLLDTAVCAGPANVDWTNRVLVCAKDYRLYVYDVKTGNSLKTINCGLNAELFTVVKDSIFVVNGTTVAEYEIGDILNELDS